MLHALGIAFEYQVPVEAYVVDFLVGRTVVEVYGDYWHGPKMAASKRTGADRKIARLRELGYEVVVVRESDVFTKTDLVVDTLRNLG